MNEMTIGLLIGLSVIVLMILGLPIWLSLGAVALVIMIMLGPAQYNLAGEIIFNSLYGVELLALPLFILMSAFFAQSRAGRDLYELAFRLLSKLPGNLAIANVFACAVFSALSGSSPATVAAIGGVGIPEMQKRGFPTAFAGAVIATAGGLGILIPPSITMIIYGVAVQESIGKLFLAGILPGILLVILYSLWCAIYWLLWGKKSKQYVDAGIKINFSWKERVESLYRSWPSVLLIVFIISSLYTGIATPSEIAAIGLVLSFLMVLFWYRSLNFSTLTEILTKGSRESSMLMLVLAGAILLTYPLSYLRIPQTLSETLVSLDASPWVILIIINIILLILGMFIPPAAIIVMVAPIIVPVITALGFDPIWFAVILTLNMEIGLFTPPVGLNLFVVKSIVPDLSLTELFKHLVPFIMLIIIAMVLICIFPEIALWLPSQML